MYQFQKQQQLPDFVKYEVGFFFSAQASRAAAASVFANAFISEDVQPDRFDWELLTLHGHQHFDSPFAAFQLDPTIEKLALLFSIDCGLIVAVFCFPVCCHPLRPQLVRAEGGTTAHKTLLNCRQKTDDCYEIMCSCNFILFFY